MNWKLIFLLPLFGLGMGYATVYGLPAKAEPFAWLPILLLCAYIIARYGGQRHFLLGFLTGLVCSVWVIGIHIQLSQVYLAHHPVEAVQFMKMHNESGATVAQCIMLTVGLKGILSSLVLGSFSRMVAGFLRKMT